tara:strand:- start:9 stop:1289 length:1281 start_codon:yes stop_codon:yes gene_type:complete
MSEDRDALLAARREAMEGTPRRAPGRLLGGVALAALLAGVGALLLAPEQVTAFFARTSSAEEMQEAGYDAPGISTEITLPRQAEPVPPSLEIAPPPPPQEREEPTREDPRLAALEAELAAMRRADAARAGEIRALLDDQAEALRAQFDRERVLMEERHRAALAAQASGEPASATDPETARRDAEERARRRALQEAQIASDGIVLDAGTLAASGAAPGPSRRLSGKERFMEAASIAAHDIAQAGAIGDPARTIVQGTSLDAVLETAISTELPGIVRAAISQDVWSWDGSAVLLPKGTRLIGRYNADVSIAQARAQVAWSRAVTPEGVSVALGGYGADAIGRSGQEDGELDTRFAERFGSAALISLISLAPNLAAGSDANSQDAVEQVGDDARRTTQNVMAEYLRLSPVIYVDQGARISVIVNRDLVF